MRMLRRLTVSLFVLTLSLFAGLSIYEKVTADDSIPQLNVPQSVLYLSIEDGEEELLRGITAYDEKDGDLTAEVIVESVSQFINKGESLVTYAVVDGDDHVAKGSRTIRYIDYTSPRFYLKRSPIYRQGEEIDLHQLIGARDCLDGDISDRVAILATDYANNALGTFRASFQANNSRGDMIYLDLPVHVEPVGGTALDFRLKDNLVYVKKGTEMEFRSYVDDVYFEGSALPDYRVLITADYNPAAAGVYQTHYLASDGEGHQGHAILTIVVEE